ncbi:hypothetical protein GW17_00023361 [Ensete ventricosum]|nr:hypothetical protein GW17_00023361 [Ensete ventricosum]RZS14147.1 hypothetical protein BHM03_00045809 [Ensete ventricosum]
MQGKKVTTESKGCRGCSGNGSKETAAGKKGEEERWQRQLRQRRGVVTTVARTLVVAAIVGVGDRWLCVGGAAAEGCKRQGRRLREGGCSSGL